MALQGPIPVEFGAGVPGRGVRGGGFEPVRDFDASNGTGSCSRRTRRPGCRCGWSRSSTPTRRRGRGRSRSRSRRRSSRCCPAGTAGLPFVPVEFTGLTVTPYVNQAGRLAYSLKAAGVRAPGRGRPGPGGEGGGGMRSGGGSFGRVGMYVGEDWWRVLSTYADTRRSWTSRAGRRRCRIVRRRPAGHRPGAWSSPGSWPTGGQSSPPRSSGCTPGSRRRRAARPRAAGGEAA